MINIEYDIQPILNILVHFIQAIFHYRFLLSSNFHLFTSFNFKILLA